MARKRTGLRNKFRTGKSTYSIRKKSTEADRYGSWSQGKRVAGAEVIAGRSMNYRLGD